MKIVGLIGGPLIGLAPPAWATTRPHDDGAIRAVLDDEEDGAQRRGEDIVVNGRRHKRYDESGAKTDRPLIALPQNVVAIDNDELTRRNALSINQALGYVAGVSPNQRGNVATRYDQLYLRGFTPGIFMDGMRLLSGVYASPQVDFHLVESVEVIKGPASVLYGNATPGGLVNLISKLPHATPGGRIELAAGNYALMRSAIDVNQPIDRGGR